MTVQVDYNKLQNSLNIFSDHLKQLETSRDKLIKENREIISLCSKSIVLIHSNNIKEATELLDKALSLILELRQFVVFDLERYLYPAEQEYVEAIILKEIVEKKYSLSGHDDLKVSLSPYVTGLLDCIGEIKRMIYDNLRKDDFDFAISLFNIMQSIFDFVYPFSFYDNIINGIRKKLDTAKRIIDDVRISITEEYRRKAFLDQINNSQIK